MVCDKCEKKLSKVICPEVWKPGAGGRSQKPAPKIKRTFPIFDDSSVAHCTRAKLLSRKRGAQILSRRKDVEIVVVLSLFR